MYDMIVIFAFNLKFTSCQPDRRSLYFLHRREGNQKLCTISFSIHPKNESLGSPDSANYFKFFAKGLAENAKTTKFELFAGLILSFHPKNVQSLIKSFKHIIFSTKIPFLHYILVILLIYALLSQNLCTFLANLLRLKNRLRFFTFWMYDS